MAAAQRFASPGLKRVRSGGSQRDGRTRGVFGGGLFLIAMVSATPDAGGAPLRVTIRGDGGSKPGLSMGGAVGLAAKWGVVTSVHRTPERNRAVGGRPNSWHLQGRAVDIARRPGVRHAEIDAAYRRAGYVLIESLDEGDHSHFAFGLPGEAPRFSPAAKVRLASAEAEQPKGCTLDGDDLLSRRRPDRRDGCTDPADPAPRLRPYRGE